MPSSPCLLLIRHAQSQNNALADQYRVPDPELTALGHRQSRQLAEAVVRLKPTILYCSPFLRSLQTTEPVAKRTGLTPIVRQDIYEQGGCHRGYQDGNRFAEPGLNRSQLASRYPGWNLDVRIGDQGWYDLDHYESEQESRARALRVRRWFENGTTHHSLTDRVAMIIHADFKMHLLITFLEQEDLEHSLECAVNTSISCLTYQNQRWCLDYWNDYEHLRDDLISE